MPHYVPRYLPQSGYVLDAERLQRELQRGEHVMGHLDQHSLKIDSISPTALRAPSSEGDTYLQAFASGSILLDEASSTGLSSVTDRERWQALSGLSMSLTLSRQHYLNVECSAEIQADAADVPSWVDVQVLVDGSRTGASASSFFDTGSAIQTVYMQDSIAVQPGAHLLTVRARVRNGEAATVTQALVVARGSVA